MLTITMETAVDLVVLGGLPFAVALLLDRRGRVERPTAEIAQYCRQHVRVARLAEEFVSVAVFVPD